MLFTEFPNYIETGTVLFRTRILGRHLSPSRRSKECRSFPLSASFAGEERRRGKDRFSRSRPNSGPTASYQETATEMQKPIEYGEYDE